VDIPPFDKLGCDRVNLAWQRMSFSNSITKALSRDSKTHGGHHREDRRGLLQLHLCTALLSSWPHAGRKLGQVPRLAGSLREKAVAAVLLLGRALGGDIVDVGGIIRVAARS
jgi:hypothetical protein